MNTTTFRKIALTAFAALIFAACNTTLTLDTENLQRLIATEIEAQNVQNGITVSGVTCPERPIQQGDVFECTATTSAGNYRVQVTQKDAVGNVKWEITGQL